MSDPHASDPHASGPHAPSGSVDADVARVIDARGLSCPMPVLELAKAVDQIEIGDVVRLLATDPTAKVDVPVWCRMQRQGLRSQHLDDNVLTFEVQRLR